MGSTTLSHDTENMIVSASRDRTLLVWNLLRQKGNFGEPRKSLKGHSHFVQVWSISLSSTTNFTEVSISNHTQLVRSHNVHFLAGRGRLL
jgi:WD40 repeat protein